MTYLLESQLYVLYRDKDFHKENSMELLKYIFQFNLQSCLPEVVKLLKMNGVFAVSSASVERSFSCLKRVKPTLKLQRAKTGSVVFVEFQSTKIFLNLWKMQISCMNWHLQSLLKNQEFFFISKIRVNFHINFIFFG